MAGAPANRRKVALKWREAHRMEDDSQGGMERAQAQQGHGTCSDSECALVAQSAFQKKGKIRVKGSSLPPGG